MMIDDELKEQRDRLLKINTLHLSNGFRSLLKVNKMTLDDFSVDSGLDIAYLSRVQNGKILPTFNTFTTMLSVFDMTIKEFYDYIDYLNGVSS